MLRSLARGRPRRRMSPFPSEDVSKSYRTFINYAAALLGRRASAAVRGPRQLGHGEAGRVTAAGRGGRQVASHAELLGVMREPVGSDALQGEVQEVRKHLVCRPAPQSEPSPPLSCSCSLVLELGVARSSSGPEHHAHPFPRPARGCRCPVQADSPRSRGTGRR